MELSNKLKSIRKLRNFTQETVAEKLGISTYSYAKIERGETDVKYSRLQQITKIMGIELEDLFSWDDKKVFNFNENNLSNYENNIQNIQLYQEINSNSIGHMESKHELEKANLIIEQRDKEINSLKQEINTLKQHVSDLRDMINILKPGTE
jgi:transcriptional regulator with XRE-family HTH domain